jgi:methylated-DNA-[protein]-cysteine S-methyltransferase
MHYTSPLGDILLASRNEKLIGVWFEGQKHYLDNISENIIENEDKILSKTKNWLDKYFNGKKPPINELDLAPEGTNFRCEVWKILCEIPYGKTTSYADIALKIAKNRGIEKMSSQAVGGAVGHNPISIIIPCHRVIGSNGKLTGYAAGLDKKIFLLKHENVIP